MKRRWWQEHRTIVAILVLYLGLGSLYSLVVPAFEAPDEPAHFDYVRYLAIHHRFPVQQPDLNLSPTLEAHQPPLYYLLGAVLTAWIDQAGFEPTPPNPCVQWSPDVPGQRHVYLHGQSERPPYHGGWLALRLVRGLSILLGGVTIWATYQLGRTIWPDRTRLALAAAAVVAFNPQFLFIHSAINNDNLATTLSALVLLVAARAIESTPNWKRAALLGLLLGLGALTKYSALALTLVAFSTLVPAIRNRDWRQATAHLVLLLLIPALVAGWWYARNLRLYGDLWAWQVALASHPHDVRIEPLAWSDLRLFVARVFASFWGYFGWLTVRFPPTVYIILAVVTVIGVAELIMALLRPKVQVRLSLSAALLATASVMASLGRYILTYNYTAYQGRLLFPAVSAIAVLLIYGLARLIGERHSGWLFVAVVTGGLILTAIGIGSLLLAYPRPAIYETASLANMPQPCVVFGERVQLLAYDVTPQAVKSGETLRLTLHWFGLDELSPGSHLAIHMLGRNGRALAHATLVPRLRPNQASTEEISLQVGDTMRPTRGRLQLQFLDASRRAYPVTTRNRHPLGHLFELSSLKVIPAQPPSYVYQKAVGARLGEAITLLGYDLSAFEVAPGETLHLILYWRAQASPADDYTVFVHLMDEKGQPLAQVDGPPDGGNYPTTMWEAGEQIKDDRPILISHEMLPGHYRLGMGLYQLTTGERLPAFDALGNRLAVDTIVLTEVIVRQP